LSREGEWLAAVLAAGDGAGLASLSAAFLHQLTRFEPPQIHVITPKRRRRQHGFVLHTCRNLDPRDITRFNGIPVTTVARTLVDLTDAQTPDELANVIHEAAFKNRFSLPATRAAMERAPGRKLSVLEEAIRLYETGSAGTRSRFERRFLHLARAAGFPEPIKNSVIHDFEVDFRWDTLCVEADGGGHKRPRSKTDDRIRDAALKAHGFTIVRFAEDDVDQRPDYVIATLRQATAHLIPSLAAVANLHAPTPAPAATTSPPDSEAASQPPRSSSAP
jgi:very-short-patch-repair endonuclease